MNRQAFAVSIDNLFAYFQRKKPAMGAVDQWYRDLANIPETALDEIEAQIKTGESLPRNIPNAYRDGWRAWQQCHPDKIAKHTATRCADCLSKGFIWYRLNKFLFVCRCANCENWQRDCNAALMPAYTRSQLLEMGATIDG